MKIEYNKLVRDKIPQIIEESGKRYSTKVLSPEEHSEMLRKKLVEECNEFFDSGETEELADILEVVHALIKDSGSSFESVEEMRSKKADKRGGFDKRILLEWVE